VSTKRRVPLLACLALLGLIWVAPSEAQPHTSATVSAVLKERRSTDRWVVEITWTASCQNIAEGKTPVYSGHLYMVDVDTGERHYVGGVVDTSGQRSVSHKRDWSVSARRREQHLRPELTIYCYETSPQVGGPTITVTGNVVTIPRSFEGRGSGGRGGGGDYGAGDPTAPLGAGGCRNALVGTDGPDTLTGSGEGDVIFGFGGDDLIRGGDDHDCLIGGRGNDRLYGGRGNDRLVGGRGKDVLVGGPGVNVYDAGPGSDYVNARNGKRELVRCGPGKDRARVDGRDRVRSCERVSRPR
jgi:hypothetical protein